MAFKLVLLSALLVAANALPKPQVLTKTSAIRPVTYTTGGIAYPSPAYGAYSVPTGVHYPNYALPGYVSGVRTIGDAPTHVIAGTGLRTFAASPAAAIHNFASAPAVAAAPAVRAVAVPTPVRHLANDEEYDPNPTYSYSYSVNDAETGDSKSAEESRNGDSVQGKYSLIESDGSLRTVEYTADPINGFNAVVHRETGAAVPPPAPIKAETYSAPGAIKVAAAPYVPAPAISYKAVEQPYIALKNTPSVTYTGAPAALTYSQAIPTALRYSQAIPTAVKYSTPVLSTAGNVQTSLVTPYSSYTY